MELASIKEKHGNDNIKTHARIDLLTETCVSLNRETRIHTHIQAEYILILPFFAYTYADNLA